MYRAIRGRSGPLIATPLLVAVLAACGVGEDGNGGGGGGGDPQERQGNDQQPMDDDRDDGRDDGGRDDDGRDDGRDDGGQALPYDSSRWHVELDLAAGRAVIG